MQRCEKHRFLALPKRWIGQRTIGWICRNRRLVRDFERHCRSGAVFARIATMRIMLRCVAATTSACIVPSRIGSEEASLETSVLPWQ